jgi:hypothetical protein|tara:strand:+ start:442 stop:654 length:213 start_codon:yes stop_codon:yes gene_type:complete
MIDDDIIEMMIEIISLTGEYVKQSEEDKYDYDEEMEQKYRKLVISAYIYIGNLEELLKGGSPPKPPGIGL